MSSDRRHGPDDRVLDRLRKLADRLPGPLRPLVRELVDHPGKCLRSTLLVRCADLGRPDPNRVIRSGALVEMIHLASLLHDDVIDRAEVRRGRPAAHVVAGGELAMLAGLACFAEAGREASVLGAATNLAVGEAVAALAYGEMLDAERAFDTSFGLDGYLELVAGKTGALFRLSCLLGAIEAGLDPPTTRAAARFGHELGIAFQILDDCLDFGTDEPTKPVGTDHLLGLFGAPTLYALRRDRSGELAELLLRSSFTVADLPKVRELVTYHGGLDLAEELARKRRARALSALADLPGTEARAALDGVVGLVLGGLS